MEMSAVDRGILPVSSYCRKSSLSYLTHGLGSSEKRVISPNLIITGYHAPTAARHFNPGVGGILYGARCGPRAHAAQEGASAFGVAVYVIAFPQD